MPNNHIITIQCITELANLIDTITQSYDKHDILVVFDIDDTLITIPRNSHDYTAYLNKYNVSHHEVYDLCDRIPQARIDYICGIRKVPCQPETHQTLSHIVNNYHVTALTSRCHSLHHATYNDLADSAMHIIESNPFYKLHNDYHDIDNKYAYHRNTISISGQNKGTILKYFIDKHGHDYKMIILIDDTRSKLVDFINAFINTDIAIKGIHYVKYNDKQ